MRRGSTMGREVNGKGSHRQLREEEVEEKRKKQRKGEKDERKKERKRSKKPERKVEDGKEAKIVPTVSVAIAGSIIDNAQSPQLATHLAGRIARALTIFRIDEVIVFDNNVASLEDSTTATVENDETGAQFLVRILQYLETPQYLRRSLFPMHKSLTFVGLLPPLDAPHHVRKHDWSPFREGITLEGGLSNSKGTLVNVGLYKNIWVDQVLEPGTRVTVAMGSNHVLDSDSPKTVVSREETGSYWGYKVRYASRISSVFTESPYKGGYDQTIGTSEHGRAVNSSELDIPNFRHLLIAFGGLEGLEESIEKDNKLKGKDVNEIFNDYLNTCPNQGSRTIRTEEAIFICLQYFQEPISRAVQRLERSCH